MRTFLFSLLHCNVGCIVTLLHYPETGSKHISSYIN